LAISPGTSKAATPRTIAPDKPLYEITLSQQQPVLTRVLDYPCPGLCAAIQSADAQSCMMEKPPCRRVCAFL